MFVLFLLALALPLRAQNEILRWRPAAALATARSNACAVRMADGRVLVTGGTGNDGPTNSAELFHAAPEEKFEAVAPMLAPRTGHACVLLGDGRVLVAGGESSGAPAAEVYDPTIQEWIGVASTLPANRGAGLSATLLPDGRVLLVGGALAGIEAYDPDTGELQVLTVRLTAPRQRHTATLLADGRVLLAGGMVDGKSVGIAEIFDAATSTLTATASLAGERSSHTATLLSDTRVLIAGGSAGSEERAEL
ncbi:MAG TPA: hypothetical protein VM120_13430, partial [Bryobacteraceae bacterium]|nr:hypothetical protein [Bryobacteraceae bacterium]